MAKASIFECSACRAVSAAPDDLLLLPSCPACGNVMRECRRLRKLRIRLEDALAVLRGHKVAVRVQRGY